MLGSHHGDDIHRLGEQNFVASDSSPEVRPTEHSYHLRAFSSKLIVYYKKNFLVLVILVKL